MGRKPSSGLSANRSILSIGGEAGWIVQSLEEGSKEIGVTNPGL